MSKPILIPRMMRLLSVERTEKDLHAARFEGGAEDLVLPIFDSEVDPLQKRVGGLFAMSIEAIDKGFV